ncbi:hypothetical protein [Hoeflea sp.]|uniref:hypothetical protein n=1 Tax=Hoeflea sp. TaxID=1940281 RepID=UPI003749A212
MKSFSSMFLEYPNQASRYQGTLLKTVNRQVFQKNHKPEPYFCSALALYRFEVLTRRLTAQERVLKSFRYYFLLAFRYRFEPNEYPGANSKHIGAYCDFLIQNLTTAEKSKDSFDEVCGLVQESLQNLGLALERDNAKSRPLIEEVKRLARSKK